MQTDVVVIGAGMAGVTAARELARAGLSVLIVEGRDRIGGRIFTVRDFCAKPVEGGAEFIHGVDAETWPDVRAAGLKVRPCPQARDALFNIGHGTHWLPVVLLHPGVWRSFFLLRAIRKLKPPDLSAREFIEKNGYRGRARAMAELMLTAHLPGSLEQVGMLGLLEDRVLELEMGVNHRVTNGYDELPRFIARGLDVRLGFRVTEIEWSAKEVRVRAADGREVRARAAVNTLPVGVLKSGSVRFLPDLPERKKAALACLEMGPVAKVLLRFEEPFWPRRMASLVCATGPVTLYWAVFYGAPDPLPVLTAYCTGPRAAALSKLSEEDAVQGILRDLRRHFPKASPRLTAYQRVNWTSDPLACGGYTFVRPGGSGARARLAAPDTGALFWAGSATATTTIAASVQGAFVSGQRAASEVQRYLENRP